MTNLPAVKAVAVRVLDQRDQHAEVGVLLHVEVEVLDLPVDEVLLEDHVALAIASAASVPACAGSHSSANFTLSAAGRG